MKFYIKPKNIVEAKPKRAVFLKEIPERFRHGMKLLNPNSGATSLVFDKGDGTVRIFTRDGIKKEWLTQSWGLNLGNHVEYIETPNNRFNKDIVVVDMPKLFPVSGANKNTVQTIVKAFKEAQGMLPRVKRYEPYEVLEKTAELLSDKYKDKKAFDIVDHLYSFATNYDADSFVNDMGIRQFKQDADGNLILLDPLADKELIETLYNIKPNRGW